MASILPLQSICFYILNHWKLGLLERVNGGGGVINKCNFLENLYTFIHKGSSETLEVVVLYKKIDFNEDITNGLCLFTGTEAL